MRHSRTAAGSRTSQRARIHEVGVERSRARLILAAGAGRRFGGAKQLAELRGRPLLVHAVEAMLAVPALEPVVVVLGARGRRDRARASTSAAPSVVVAADWDDGQSASLQRGVARARRRRRGRGHARRPAVHHPGGDRAGRSQFDRPARRRARDLRRACRATPSLLARPLIARVGELRGDVGFRDLLEGARVRRFECGELCDPVDVDTREALDGLR